MSGQGYLRPLVLTAGLALAGCGVDAQVAATEGGPGAGANEATTDGAAGAGGRDGSGGHGGDRTDGGGAADRSSSDKRPPDGPPADRTAPKDPPPPGSCNSNADCPADEWCHDDTSRNHGCRATEQACVRNLNVYCDATSGTCIARPTSCKAGAIAYNCGCDGKTYDNPCLMYMAGVSIAKYEACE